MTSPGIAEAIAFRSDHWETILQRRLGSRIRNLRVVVRDDGIVLQGYAPTYHAKQIAQHAAMELVDLPIVANDIEVR